MMGHLDLEEAVRKTQKLVGEHDTYSFPQFPLVRADQASRSPYFGRPTNILLIFVEGFDRRYLGRIVDTKDKEQWSEYVVPGEPRSWDLSQDELMGSSKVLLTTFLDRMKHESIYIKHFFSNGRSTMCGLFATLCSYFPRAGWDVIRTRYGQDFLCLPSVLKMAGYRTEMVIAQSRGSNRGQIGPFMARHGFEQLYDANDFPRDAEQLGIGFTDRALFQFMQERLFALQKEGQPFFLTTLTVGTHHPYNVPLDHPEVQILSEYPDGFVVALRSLDLELERFMDRLGKQGLLNNTLVFLMGDHGRHEWRPGGGGFKVVDWVGHHMTPLFIWADPSLRTEKNYYPRVVDGVASHVDVMPTILGLNGLRPKLSPFLGRDLSCLMVRDCVLDNMALIGDTAHLGLAGRSGFMGYAMDQHVMFWTDIEFSRPLAPQSVDDFHDPEWYHTMLSLFVSSQTLLEQNRVWSWKKFGDKL